MDQNISTKPPPNAYRVRTDSMGRRYPEYFRIDDPPPKMTAEEYAAYVIEFAAW